MNKEILTIDEKKELSNKWIELQVVRNKDMSISNIPVWIVDFKEVLKDIESLLSKKMGEREQELMNEAKDLLEMGASFGMLCGHNPELIEANIENYLKVSKYKLN